LRDEFSGRDDFFTFEGETDFFMERDSIFPDEELLEDVLFDDALFEDLPERMPVILPRVVLVVLDRTFDLVTGSFFSSLFSSVFGWVIFCFMTLPDSVTFADGE